MAGRTRVQAGVLVVAAGDDNADPWLGWPARRGHNRGRGRLGGPCPQRYENEAIARDVVDHRECDGQRYVGNQLVQAKMQQPSIESQIEGDRDGLLGVESGEGQPEPRATVAPGEPAVQQEAGFHRDDCLDRI